MANLEIALVLIGRGTNPENKVLFAFWAAEEWGLIGSRHFVQNLLSNDVKDDIALNLNFDMIVSSYTSITLVTNCISSYIAIAV